MDTRIMAKMRYFPSSGTTSDVGGMISTTSKKNTYKLVRIEMDSVTWRTKSETTVRRLIEGFSSENKSIEKRQLTIA